MSAARLRPPALRAMIEDAYSGFRHPAVAPLAQLDANLFTLELFHGPTLAFKDLAMQLLARLIDHALKARGQRATVIGATSGDTGAAAIEAFSGLAQVDVFILYPHGRVSDVQRRQMTTVGAANVHAIAIEGSFDDAQAVVKALFRQQGAARETQPLRRQFDQLGAHPRPDRLLFHQRRRARRACTGRSPSSRRPAISATSLAGMIAKRMGLPIERLVIASNANDILPRALESGTYYVGAASGDAIAVDGHSGLVQFRAAAVRGRWSRRRGGRAPRWRPSRSPRAFHIEAAALAAIRADFDAVSVSEAETSAEIARLWREAHYLADPHTAVGMARRGARRRCAGRKRRSSRSAPPMPAKFPDAIEARDRRSSRPAAASRRSF